MHDIFTVDGNLFAAADPNAARNVFRERLKTPACQEELPKFEDVSKKLPEPVWEGHENVLDTYRRAWEIAFGNLRTAKREAGFVSDFIDTAFNGFLFMWDSSFIVMFGKYGAAAFNFQQTLDNFYAHQHAGIRADIITSAKGMANGFPIGAVLISPAIKAKSGMLGTTFGGNHLACAAAIAVLEIMREEHLVENAAKVGEYFKKAFEGDKALKEYRGRGLMIGLELKEEYIGLRDKLLFEKHFFTGAAGASVIRLLPSLTIDLATAERFVNAWKELTK